MKSSIIVLTFFAIGCLTGLLTDARLDGHNISMYILYVLMLQVGINIGCKKDLKQIVSQLHIRMLAIPLATVVGTLLFSALASVLLSRWSVFDCMAVGSGFAYYSLSSILITQFKEVFGKLAPISAAGVNSMDVVLPVITRCSGREMIPIAILHGILIDVSVPLFVSLFCSL